MRVGLVGAGRAGQVHAEAIAASVRGAQLRAVVDPDHALATDVASRYGASPFTSLEAALEQGSLDAVVIAGPTFIHASAAITAARAGCHVFVEKPMALSLDEADAMISAATEAGVILQVGFMRRFDAGFLAAQEELESGAIGAVVSVRSVSRGPGLPPRWACMPSTSIGMLAEVNSHDFDTVRWLSGAEFSTVFAVADTYQCHDLAAEFPGFYDAAIVSSRMTNGVMTTIEGACPVGYGYDARVEILGTKGLITVGSLSLTATTVHTADRGVASPIIHSWRQRFRDAYIEEQRHFARSILDGTPPRVTGEDGRRALEAVLAATRSISESTPVAVALRT